MANPLVKHISLGDTMLDIADPRITEIPYILSALGNKIIAEPVLLKWHDANYSGLQSFCIRNNYIYITENDGTTNNSAIARYNLLDMGKTKLPIVSGQFGHANSITYNEDDDVFYIAGADQESTGKIFVIDPETMNVVNTLTASVANITGLSYYNSELYGYYNGIYYVIDKTSGNCTALTMITPDDNGQDILVYQDYLMKVYSEPNNVGVYNRSGQLLGYIPIGNVIDSVFPMTELESVRIYNNTLYIAGNIGSNGSKGLIMAILAVNLELFTKYPNVNAGAQNQTYTVSSDYDNNESFEDMQFIVNKIKASPKGTYSITMPSGTFDDEITFESVNGNWVRIVGSGSGTTYNGKVNITGDCNISFNSFKRVATNDNTITVTSSELGSPILTFGSNIAVSGDQSVFLNVENGGCIIDLGQGNNIFNDTMEIDCNAGIINAGNANVIFNNLSQYQPAIINAYGFQQKYNNSYLVPGRRVALEGLGISLQPNTDYVYTLPNNNKLSRGCHITVNTNLGVFDYTITANLAIGNKTMNNTGLRLSYSSDGTKLTFNSTASLTVNHIYIS